jgi:protein-tyrosine phosphatase
VGEEDVTNTKAESNRSQQQPPEMADLHTHLIPGVDDGAPDLDSALRTLVTLHGDGVSTVVATPHLNASDPNGTRRARADQAWPELAVAARDRLPGLRLQRGYEIQLDVPHPDLSDPGLRLAGSRFALVEFFAFTIPNQSAAVLAGIVAAGHVPIVAHPERYWGYDRELSVVREWREAGALLQLNSGSLLGEYGETIRAVAHRLLGDGHVDLIASDNHARANRSPSLRSVWDYLVANGLDIEARLLLSTNPSRILMDEPPLPVGPVKPRRGLLGRLRRLVAQARLGRDT